MSTMIKGKNMDSARSWFNKLQPREKSKKKDSMAGGKDDSAPTSDDDGPSNVTKQRVAAAKQYIEKHYKEQMKNLQERKERYDLTPWITLALCAYFDVKPYH